MCVGVLTILLRLVSNFCDKTNLSHAHTHTHMIGFYVAQDGLEVAV